MLPILTPSEMAAADRRAIDGGTPEVDLIARAGRRLAWRARALLGGVYGRRVVVLCGRGNNGADGRVAAAVLRGWGVGVDIVAVSSRAGSAGAGSAGVDRLAVGTAIGRADLVVDAMYGTGFRGVLEGDAAWCAAATNRAAAIVLAADIPSGVDGATGRVDGPAVSADATLCFQALKPGLVFEPGRGLAGEIDVVDLGIDLGAVQLHLATAADVVRPRRAPDAHKWSNAVLVVGGSPGMTGAPMLAARGAARSGAGMVVAALPGAAATGASGTEIVTRSLPAGPDGDFGDDAARLAAAATSRFAAVVVGPGLARSTGGDALAARLVAETAAGIVVDAGALDVLAADPAPLRVRRAAGLAPAILTPHAGEYARLARRDVAAAGGRVDAARDLAAALGAIIVLKGPGTVVADPDGRVVVVGPGSAALATAGTGDVLAGVIAAALAAGVDPFAAAWTGAVVHGRAGDLTGYGDATLASDVIGALPVAWGIQPDSKGS